MVCKILQLTTSQNPKEKTFELEEMSFKTFFEGRGSQTSCGIGVKRL